MSKRLLVVMLVVVSLLLVGCTEGLIESSGTEAVHDGLSGQNVTIRLSVSKVDAERLNLSNSLILGPVWSSLAVAQSEVTVLCSGERVWVTVYVTPEELQWLRDNKPCWAKGY